MSCKVAAENAYQKMAEERFPNMDVKVTLGPFKMREG